MRKFIILDALFLFAAECVQCEIKFNNEMASRCKEHISSDGSTYTKFYRVNTDDRKFDPGVEFEMHLAILAESNGHIMLSSTENPKADDPVYEFVVGGGGNTFTQLRKLQSRASKVTAFTNGILAPDAFRSFWIKVMTDGQIEFGVEGSPLTMLSYYDVDPLPIRFFSFSTWSTIRGRFLYDCHDGQNDTDHHDTYINNTIVATAVAQSNNTDVEPELTTNQELRENVTRRGRGRPDEDTTIIFVSAAVADLRFDSDSCLLEATIILVMSWVDEAISWQAEMYNGTDNLSIRNSEIWTPELVLYNSIGHGVMEPSESEYLHVTSDGVATLSLRTRQQVSCAFSDETQYRWPRDEYECNFLIGPWSMQDHLIVDLLTDDSVTKYFKSAATQALSSEWDIIHVNRSILTSQQGYSPHYGVSNSTSDEAQNTFKIHVSIKRKSYCYYLILIIPFTVIVALILLSFFLNPLSEYRVWFNCSMAVIICQFIIYLDTVVPSYTAPVILICYTVTMVMLIAMMLIQVLLQQPWCRRLFCSRPVQPTADHLLLKTNERCDAVDDDVSNRGDTTSREMEPYNVALKDAVLIIDRVVIGIYIAVYVTMAVIVYL